MDVLAIAVHPDDETLGCGGALLRHAKEGDAIHWLIVTATTAPDFTHDRIELQTRQIKATREAYGFASLHWLKLRSTRLEMIPMNEVIDGIRSAVAAVRPEIVYIPNRSDAHSDHRVTFEASMAVLKSFYMTSHGVRKVLACEVPSETDAAPPLSERAFVPNVYVDVSETFRQKLEIMKIFESEIQPKFMPRGLSAIEATARCRGAAIGVEFAEAFMLMREIV